jgi:hypothetical protein
MPPLWQYFSRLRAEAEPHSARDSTDEIRLLLEASADNAAATERLREVAERKLPELETLIERAELVRRWLEDAACCTCPTLDDCPLFDDPNRLPERERSLRCGRGA